MSAGWFRFRCNAWRHTWPDLERHCVHSHFCCGRLRAFAALKSATTVSVLKCAQHLLPCGQALLVDPGGKASARVVASPPTSTRPEQIDNVLFFNKALILTLGTTREHFVYWSEAAADLVVQESTTASFASSLL